MHLKKLKQGNSFLLRSSNEVTKVLDQRIPEFTTAFSIDIEDLYNNLPQEGFLKAVIEPMENVAKSTFKTGLESIPDSLSGYFSFTCSLQLSLIRTILC